MSQERSTPPACKIMGYEISADQAGIRIEVTDYQAGIAFIPWREVKSLQERSRHGLARLEEPIIPPEPEPLAAEPPPATVAVSPPQPTKVPAPPPLTRLEREVWGQGEGRGDFAKDD